MNPDVMIPKPGPVTPRVADPVTRTVDVVVCTFRRPHVVETLATLDAQELAPGTEMRIIVIDNDTAPTARAAVLGKAEEMRFPVAYFHAPGPNISLARNAGLDMADADLVAFIDDDCLAERRWLAALVARLERCDVDAVFGPSRAVFGATAPAWMREQDHHSNVPVRRGGEVCTGHTCNALLRWRGTPWRGERFDLARGRSGGEDTEFFFRLRRRGARFEIAEAALVHEKVTEDRQSLAWLRRRKFRMGQSYASSAEGIPAQAALAVTALTKAAYCHLRASMGRNAGARAFWVLRGALHAGVVAGCFSKRSLTIYGS